VISHTYNKTLPALGNNGPYSFHLLPTQRITLPLIRPLRYFGLS
jgi:hypothetical protein